MNVMPTAEQIVLLRRERDRYKAERDQAVEYGQRHADSLDRYKRHITEILHNAANEHNLCGEFDDLMEQCELPRRCSTSVVWARR